MRECIPEGTVGRIVLYIDEICPGNPLRPEKSRTLQAIYWAFIDWPQWILQRTSMWPVFGTIRSTIVSGLSGKVSALMRLVLRIFFPEDGIGSFAGGVTLVFAAGERFVTRARFSGFIADEKAHNEISGTKGASGTKCCISCRNVFNRFDATTAMPDGCVCITCHDPTQFDRHTNESVYAMYDHLANADPDDREELEQLLGLKFLPDGIMGDMHLRQFYRPVDHTRRDWQHTLVGNGVGNVLLAQVIKLMMNAGVTLVWLQNFICSFNLPHRHGKVEAK